jgi:anti-sigma factor RsiW
MADSIDNCRGLLLKAVEGDLNAGELARWEEHRRNCRSCAPQWEEFRQSLAELRQAPAHRLSADFEARLLRRIRTRDRAPLLTGGARWILRTYWIAAGVAGIFISTKVSWPAAMPATAWLVFALMGVGMVLPAMIWIRSQRNLLDFALKSIGLRQPTDEHSRQRSLKRI